MLLRITASADSVSECEKMIEKQLEKIEEIAGDKIYLVGDESISSSQTELHNIVSSLLVENELTISIAESLTGGKLTSMLVERSGISDSLLESIVCYSNKSKITTLGVKEETLEKYGAVSEQTAIEMVQGVAKRFNSDIAVATTGIAGPNSDESGKPVGLVYIATYYKGEVAVIEVEFVGNRELIRTRASVEALNEIIKIILKNT